MNILVTSYFERHKQLGGAEISTFLMAKKLTQKNNVYYANSQISGKHDNINYIRFKNLRFFPILYSIITLFYFLYFIKKYKIQKVYCSDRLTAIPAILASKILKTPVIVFIRDYWFCCNQSTRYHSGFVCNGSLTDELRNYNILRWPWEIHKYYSSLFGRFLLKYSDVVSISEFIQKLLLKYKISSKVIYNELDSGLLKNSKRILEYKGKFIFLYAGRLSKEKGVDILVKTFNQIGKKNVKLLILGTGPQENFLKELSKNENIEFLGRIGHDKIYDYYRTSDVIIYPVLWDEPYGRVIAEAKSMKKYIIASSKGGITEQLIGYKKGFLLKNDYEKELKNYIHAILKQKKIN